MVWPASQEIFPVPSLPKAEALHICVVVTHRGIAVWCSMKIKIYKLLHIRANNLVCINENDFLEVHREKDVKEQDLVRPNDTLLLLLRAEPRGPFVRDELVLEPIFGGKVRDEFLSKNVDR